jgi:hypothetical protein
MQRVPVRPEPVGIIANPASGKDIRRLVGHASVFDNNEKVQVVRRVLLALEAAGVQRVLAMPDYYGIVRRAAEHLALRLTLEFTSEPISAQEEDTTRAAAAMAAAGVSAIVTLGGDGTNRATALGSCRVPLVPISTGTNNVFPAMIEGSSAGLAAAALALGLVQAAEAAQPCKCLRLRLPDGSCSLALIDVAVLAPGWIGARAVYDASRLRRVLLTRALPGAMGLAGLGGLLHEVGADDQHGLDVRLTADAACGECLNAPLAPGLFRPVGVAAHELLRFGQSLRLEGTCLLALDGEREVEVGEGEAATLTLQRDGPPVVDVGRCLSLAARRGLLRC